MAATIIFLTLLFGSFLLKISSASNCVWTGCVGPNPCYFNGCSDCDACCSPYIQSGLCTGYRCGTISSIDFITSILPIKHNKLSSELRLNSTATITIQGHACDDWTVNLNLLAYKYVTYFSTLQNLACARILVLLYFIHFHLDV